MKKSYNVILEYEDMEIVVCTYSTLKAAQNFLNTFTYLPEYRRAYEHLKVSEDGMSGVGHDGNSEFTYSIQVA